MTETWLQPTASGAVPGWTDMLFCLVGQWPEWGLAVCVPWLACWEEQTWLTGRRPLQPQAPERKVQKGPCVPAWSRAGFFQTRASGVFGKNTGYLTPTADSLCDLRVVPPFDSRGNQGPGPTAAPASGLWKGTPFDFWVGLGASLVWDFGSGHWMSGAPLHGRGPRTRPLTELP